MQGAGPNPKTGHHNTHPPAIQQGHKVDDKGDASTQTGDTAHKTGSQ